MKPIAILWNSRRPSGHIEFAGQHLSFSASRTGRFDVALSTADNRSIVTVRGGADAFSFFLRDVDAGTPILIPSLGVAVTTRADKRSYAAIAAVIAARCLQTNLQQIQAASEANFADAAAHNRSLTCQTWLGIGRDIRIFAVDFHSRPDHAGAQDVIVPKFCGNPVKIAESNDAPLSYSFMLGRGVGGAHTVTRRLEDGVLPILHVTRVDDDVNYHAVMFVTLESNPLTAANVRGTDYLVADGHGAGHMFTPEQQAEYERRVAVELAQGETILCVRVNAVNTAAVPRYAFVLAPGMAAWPPPPRQATMGADGLSAFETGQVVSANRLNGAPLTHRESAVLLQPGARAVFEFYIPHRPVDQARAVRLARFDFDAKHAECRTYWQAKLNRAAQIKLPEPRVDEMVRAGLLHLDLITYGREPKGTLVPMIGVYTAIGSESAPIIQFYDSVGWHVEAERALQFFLDKQHPTGFIQNFGGYMLETGPALWSMGEHWRYTRDEKWLKRVTPQLLKACEFILAWRRRNQRADLRGHGYGLMEGKVADPEDHFRQFMLNGYAHLGLKRVAEMLQTLNPPESRRLSRAAAGFRRDIRNAIRERLAESPVIPLGDGTWCPTTSPWAEDRGALMLYAKPGAVFTHGTFTGRDSLLGPLYLVLSEVLDPGEQTTDWLLNFHAELMTTRNVAFSQPYYSRHDWTHLQRGEVKAFLQTYYNTFAGLADRETYTFWEHYFGASPHKTHEEGWFLMQTRWMLWLETGAALRLLPGIPRTWLESGQTIAIENAVSYFGPFTLHVESQLDCGVIAATIECRTNRQPTTIEIRLPHPHGLKAKYVRGGEYDVTQEIVRVAKFKNSVKVTLNF